MGFVCIGSYGNRDVSFMDLLQTSGPGKRVSERFL